MDVLLSPPLAFLIYVGLVLLLMLFGRVLAEPEKPDPMKSSVYASGEEAPGHPAAPGYQPFFLIAFFFAILHLGMLVLASSTSLTLVSVVYLVGLILALVALTLK